MGADRRLAGPRRRARASRASTRTTSSSSSPARRSLPPLTDAERTAHKVHKVAYDVALEAPPFRVIGTVYLHPGSEPERLLDRATEMFVPVVDAVAIAQRRAGRRPGLDTILVNRFYLRGVEQIDKRTGRRHQKLPGAAARRDHAGRTGPEEPPPASAHACVAASARSLTHV